MGEQPDQPIIFIGHGQSDIWKDLRDHLRDKHDFQQIRYFESGVTTGKLIKDVIDEMVTATDVAILVHTGDDETMDGRHIARQNVVHETGLFHGRLPSERVIVVRERTCEAFSNMQGVLVIEFEPGHIASVYGDVVAAIRKAVRDRAVSDVKSGLSVRGYSEPTTLEITRPPDLTVFKHPHFFWLAVTNEGDGAEFEAQIGNVIGLGPPGDPFNVPWENALDPPTHLGRGLTQRLKLAVVFEDPAAFWFCVPRNPSWSPAGHGGGLVHDVAAVERIQADLTIQNRSTDVAARYHLTFLLGPTPDLDLHPAA